MRFENQAHIGLKESWKKVMEWCVYGEALGRYGPKDAQLRNQPSFPNPPLAKSYQPNPSHVAWNSYLDGDSCGARWPNRIGCIGGGTRLVSGC